VNLEETSTFVGKDFESTLGIPPFLWACVFGLLGILLVFLLTDKDITNKAAMGCLVAYGTIGVVYLVAIILSLTAGDSYWF
jgi:hypothetical protein